MSAGPGRAERAILDALEVARTPLGAPLWLTVDEIAKAACYRLPLVPAERDSLRRATRRLGVAGDVLTAKAGDRWAASRRVAASVLRPELRRGTVIARTLSAQRQGSDQAVSKKNTESLEGKSKALPKDLQGPPVDLPQGIPFSVAGEEDEEGDGPEDITAARILNGTSRTRVAKLRTNESPFPTHSAPPDTPPAPRAFTDAELQAMGYERTGDDRYVRRDDPDEGWEILDDPGVSDEGEARPEERPDDDDGPWEPYIEPDDARPVRPLSEEREPFYCVRCDTPAVKAGACAVHLCENCHEQPWRAKRLCSACVEYARKHKGEPRPARLWKKNRKGGPAWP